MISPAKNEIWQKWFLEESHRFLLYARQQASNPYDAEDILQDALIKLIQKGYKERIPDDPFIFKTIKNKAIDYARSNIRRLRREEIAQENNNTEMSSWFHSDLERKERNQFLESKIKDLPKEQQEILVLKIWGELTFQQIAETLGVSQNTAASRYRYALHALQKAIQSSQELDGRTQT